MKAIRFRCPKCRTQHSALASRAGQAFVCKTCFGPLIVPGAPEAPSSEIPSAIEEAIAPAMAEAEMSEGPPPPEAKPRTRVVTRPLVAAVLMIAAVGSITVALRAWADRKVESITPRAETVAIVAPAPRPEVAPAPATLPDPEVRSLPVSPTAKPEEPAPRTDPDRPLVIRRRQTLDQEALRRQLAALPELGAEDRTEAALIALHQVLPPGPQGRAVAAALSPTDRERLKKAAMEERTRRRASGPQNGGGAQSGRPAMHVAREEAAPRDMLAMIREKQPELVSLPWQMGDECHLGRESAEDLQILSRAIRNLLVQATPQGDTRPDADMLRTALLEEPRDEETAEGEPQAQSPQSSPRQRRRARARPHFVVPAAIPALQQLLMAERTPVRLVLVDVLDRIECKEATKALARLAIFDLASEVRERALLAMRARPAEDYRPALLEGLRYPWAPVADHAAEALVALGDRAAVPSLVALLDRPDPLRPRTEIRDGKAVDVAPALVQVNHLQNCVLCHAPSGDPERDFVRGRVPDDSQPLPPPVEYYANSSPGLFVRADVTYLRQDFSVTQPVDDSGPWPAFQRYDYLVTERPASVRRFDLNAIGKDGYPQRDSVLFALRELTGRDAGSKSADWKAETRTDRPPPSAE